MSPLLVRTERTADPLLERQYASFPTLAHWDPTANGESVPCGGSYSGRAERWRNNGTSRDREGQAQGRQTWLPGVRHLASPSCRAHSASTTDPRSSYFRAGSPIDSDPYGVRRDGDAGQRRARRWPSASSRSQSRLGSPIDWARVCWLDADLIRASAS